MKKISTSLALVAVSFAFAQVQKGAVGINTEEPKATLDVVTKSGADKSFRVENASKKETVTVLNNGNVGIGVESPSDKLVVKEENKSTRIVLDAVADKYALNRFARNGEARWDVGMTNDSEGTGAPGSGSNYYISSSIDGSSFSRRVTISRLTGNVGIGTSTPSASLEVRASGDGAEVLKLGIERPWTFKQLGVGGDSFLTFSPDFGGKSFIIQTHEGDDIARFHSPPNTEETFVSFVTNKGRVGIGRVPRHDVKLDVEGKVRSSELAGVGDRPVVADANGILKIGTAATSTTANNTVYDADGTLAGNRTITQNNHELTFKTGTGAVNFDGNTKFKGASYVNVTKVNTTSYTVDSRKDTNGLDYYISVEETTSEVTINLPEPSQSVGRVLIISNSSSGNVALEVGGEQALSGTDNPSIAKDRAMWIVSNGKRWFNLINF